MKIQLKKDEQLVIQAENEKATFYGVTSVYRRLIEKSEIPFSGCKSFKTCRASKIKNFITRINFTPNVEILKEVEDDLQNYEPLELDYVRDSLILSKEDVEKITSIMPIIPASSFGCAQYNLQYVHFTKDCEAITTDGRQLARVKLTNTDFCKLVNSTNENISGNIHKSVFSFFKGAVEFKNYFNYFSFSDKKTTVYVKKESDIQFPNWERVIPDVSKYSKGDIDLELFDDKEMQKFLKINSNGVIHIEEGKIYSKDVMHQEKTRIGECNTLDRFSFNSEYLAKVYKILGKTTVHFNPDDHTKCVVFGNLAGDYVLTMPMAY